MLFDVVSYKSEIRNPIAKQLLGMGANPYAENYNGKSPLDLVTMIENEELIEAFRQIKRPLQSYMNTAVAFQQYQIKIK